MRAEKVPVFLRTGLGSCAGTCLGVDLQSSSVCIFVKLST